MTTATRRLALAAVVLAVVVAGIGAWFYAGDGRAARRDAGKSEKKGPQAVLVTSAVVQARMLDVYEEVVGTISRAA
jgi:hypothetical protein